MAMAAMEMVSVGGLSNDKMSAGCRRSSSWEKSCFWGLTCKVRPFDGNSQILYFLPPQSVCLTMLRVT
jgi:hypothetical protein